MFGRNPTVVYMPGPSHGGRTEYITRQVHEHRAPTDESVKLLREMEQAAEAKRIAGMRLDPNTFGGVVEVMKRGDDYSTEAHARFEINGRRLNAKAEVSGLIEPTEELMIKLRDEMARVIASAMLGEMLKRMPR
jgi:hypothetical protein